MSNVPIVAISPSFDRAINLLKSAIKSKQLIIIIGSCKVRYSGRAGSYLEEGERVIIIKNDGSLLVHRDVGYKPVNWQPPGSSISIRGENGSIVIFSQRNKPLEKLLITMSNIKVIIAYRLVDVGEFSMYLTEDDLQRILFENPTIIESGLRAVMREKELKSGRVDIFAIDKEGNPVLIEVKRGRVGEKEVLQLYKYVSEIKVTNPNVRGILVSPELEPRAQMLINELGLEYKSVDLVKLSKKYGQFKDEKVKSLGFWDNWKNY